ncbi:response regulator [Duganella sp. FT135W]|uniref:Response regulator n=1 Tax=Duganella flavida TaxID=2692175 RepID=A0A6L8K5Y0_9BURK|nr:response regulator transcription factor [Duganella flavida]MYM22650.1 response regulator [Duganella flavida]
MPYHHQPETKPANGLPIRILIADDHQLLREGLQAVIAKAADMTLVATASSGEEAVEKFKATIPDVTLMDVRMPGMDGLGAIEAIRAFNSNAKIIALSTYAGDALVRSVQRLGARGYLLKSMLAEKMFTAIRDVHAGCMCWPPDDGRGMMRTKDELSPREREVIHFVACGGTNKEIGLHLGITEETVKGYMRSILPKLGASDRANAVAISLQRGILNAWELEATPR